LRIIRYDTRDETFVIEGGYRTTKRRGLPVAPLEQLFDVSLVSFRDAAVAFRRTGHKQPLELAWVDRPTEVLQRGQPALGLNRLISDGSKVWVSTLFYVAERDEFPEDSDSAAALVARNIRPVAEKFGGKVEVKVKPFIPGDLREVKLIAEISTQRTTIGEVDAFANSLRDQGKDGAARYLGTPEGVIQALTFAPGALVGQFESQWLEAKRELYDLTRTPQKIELAKDVAALANSGGGLIIFGFSTKSELGGDRITRARSIDSSSLRSDRYMQILRARIHPFPEGIKIASASESLAGFAYIRVPRQPEELYPFMLRQTASKGGIRSTSLTIPVRSGATVEYSNPESIHSLIVAGRAALRASAPWSDDAP